MSKFFVGGWANKPEDWRSLLAKPEKQWETGYSAKTLACCWQEANDFPKSVRNVFEQSGLPLFKNIELLIAFPEYRVYLPPKEGHPSQNDIFILAKGNDQLVSITVEGKVDEPFGETVDEWRRKSNSEGRKDRLEFLIDELMIENPKIETIRYQLLHRTASAIIEARKFNAKNALMLVHIFHKSDEKFNESFKDYEKFLSLYGLSAKQDSIVEIPINGIKVYFGWVNGEVEYLNR